MLSFINAANLSAVQNINLKILERPVFHFYLNFNVESEDERLPKIEKKIKHHTKN